jgi:hypothetical protein
VAAAGAVVEAMLTVEGIVAVQLHLASGDTGFPLGVRPRRRRLGTHSTIISRCPRPSILLI